MILTQEDLEFLEQLSGAGERYTRHWGCASTLGEGGLRHRSDDRSEFYPIPDYASQRRRSGRARLTLRRFPPPWTEDHNDVGVVQKTPRRLPRSGFPDLGRANRAAFIGGWGTANDQLKAIRRGLGRGDWGAERLA
jgi:hypothetical protein